MDERPREKNTVVECRILTMSVICYRVPITSEIGKREAESAAAEYLLIIIDANLEQTHLEYWCDEHNLSTVCPCIERCRMVLSSVSQLMSSE